MESNHDFVWADASKYVWLLIIAAGMTNVISWHIKLMGYRYDKVSRIAPIFYLESVYSFAYDLLIYNVGFHKLAMIGIIVVLLFFILKIFITLCTPLDEEESSIRTQTT